MTVPKWGYLLGRPHGLRDQMGGPTQGKPGGGVVFLGLRTGLWAVIMKPPLAQGALDMVFNYCSCRATQVFPGR